MCIACIADFLGLIAGITVLYLITAAANMDILIPHALDMRIWIIVFTVCVLPLVWIRKLDHIAFTSFIGAASVVLVALLVVGEAFEVEDIDSKTHAFEAEMSFTDFMAGELCSHTNTKSTVYIHAQYRKSILLEK